jgi:hypothetical protein
MRGLQVQKSMQQHQGPYLKHEHCFLLLQKLIAPQVATHSALDQNCTTLGFRIVFASLASTECRLAHTNSQRMCIHF